MTNDYLFESFSEPERIWDIFVPSESPFSGTLRHWSIHFFNFLVFCFVLISLVRQNQRPQSPMKNGDSEGTKYFFGADKKLYRVTKQVHLRTLEGKLLVTLKGIS